MRWVLFVCLFVCPMLRQRDAKSEEKQPEANEFFHLHGRIWWESKQLGPAPYNPTYFPTWQPTPPTLTICLTYTQCGSRLAVGYSEGKSSINVA